MTAWDMSRHGFSTYEPDDSRGSEPAGTAKRVPELLEYERQALERVDAPPSTPVSAVPRAPRRPKFWRVAGAALAAVALLAGGVAIGFTVRKGTVDRQHRR